MSSSRSSGQLPRPRRKPLVGKTKHFGYDHEDVRTPSPPFHRFNCDSGCCDNKQPTLTDFSYGLKSGQRTNVTSQSHRLMPPNVGQAISASVQQLSSQFDFPSPRIAYDQSIEKPLYIPKKIQIFKNNQESQTDSILQDTASLKQKNEVNYIIFKKLQDQIDANEKERSETHEVYQERVNQLETYIDGMLEENNKLREAFGSSQNNSQNLVQQLNSNDELIKELQEAKELSQKQIQKQQEESKAKEQADREQFDKELIQQISQNKQNLDHINEVSEKDLSIRNNQIYDLTSKLQEANQKLDDQNISITNLQNTKDDQIQQINSLQNKVKEVQDQLIQSNIDQELVTNAKQKQTVLSDQKFNLTIIEITKERDDFEQTLKQVQDHSALISSQNKQLQQKLDETQQALFDSAEETLIKTNKSALEFQKLQSQTQRLEDKILEKEDQIQNVKFELKQTQSAQNSSQKQIAALKEVNEFMLIQINDEQNLKKTEKSASVSHIDFLKKENDRLQAQLMIRDDDQGQVTDHIQNLVKEMKSLREHTELVQQQHEEDLLKQKAIEKLTKDDSNNELKSVKEILKLSS